MAAGATYEPIASQTLASAAASITFNSIPQTYTDLRLSLVFTQSIASGQAGLEFNTDGATNYSWTRIGGNGTAAGSGRATSQSFIIINDDYNIGSSTTIPIFSSVDIFSYTGSTYKTTLIQSASDYNGSGTVWDAVGLWRSTAAITKIVLNGAGSSRQFNAGTTATLYGIKAA